MPVVFNRLAAACPPIVVPGAVFDPVVTTFPSDGSSPAGPPWATSPIISRTLPPVWVPLMNTAVAQADLAGRLGSIGGYGVEWGLGLLDLDAYGVPITQGVASLDKPVMLPRLSNTDPTVPAGNPNDIAGHIPVVDNADNYLWLAASGVLLPVVGSTTPPTGVVAYLGLGNMASGVLTRDGSGVLYRAPGGLWERRTADTGIPLDTPPAGIRFIQHSVTTDYFWDGAKYRPLFYLDMHAWMPGRPNASEVLVRWITPRPFTLLAGLPLSLGKAGTAATGSTVFSLQKNGVQFGTATFAPAGTVAAFAVATDTAFVPGDLISIVAPASADATLADISLVLVGTL